MYLNVRENVTEYNYGRAQGTAVRIKSPKYDTLVSTTTIKGMKEVPLIVTTEYTVIYWRKANQIHGWFVNRLGSDEDNCQRIPVSRDNLVKLHETCSVLLDTKSVELAKELLPPMDGFFFQAGGGPAQLDEGYWLDLQHTHEELGKLLEQITEENKWNYNLEYQASW